MKLSIIIVTYNSERVIKECLKSIYETVKNLEFEIVVVDNLSKDRTVEIIKSEFPDVKLVEKFQNLGFSKGVNLGVRESSGEYLLLMNPDMVLIGQVARETLDFLEMDDEAGVAGCKFVYPDYKVQASFGNFPSLVTEFVHSLSIHKLLPFGRYVPYNSLNKKYFDNTLEVDWVSGGFMMVTREVFDEVGGLDERFFLYLEDVDFCKRVSEKGHKIFYFPRVQVIHHHMDSSKQDFAGAVLNEANSLAEYFKKYDLDLQVLRFFVYIKLFFQIIKHFVLSIGSPESRFRLKEYRKALMELDI